MRGNKLKKKKEKEKKKKKKKKTKNNIEGNIQKSKRIKEEEI